jgi:hypothetical protein
MNHLIDLLPREQEILVAIAYPDGTGGLRSPVRLVEEGLAALGRAYPLPRVLAWHSVAEALLHKVEVAAAESPWLVTASSNVDRHPTYRHFAQAASAPHEHEGAENLNLITGAIVLHAVTLAQPVSDSIGRSLARLRRPQRNTTMSAEWARLARRFPVSSAELEELEASLRSDDLRALVSCAKRALAAAVAELPVTDESSSETAGCATTDVDRPGRQAAQKRGSGSSESGDDDDEGEDDEEEDDEGEELARRSLVRWSIRKGVKTPTRERLGAFSTWNRLHPRALAAVTRSLVSHLSSSIPELVAFAVLAVCCLVTGLPSRLALRIALSPNDDLWLDLERGALVWNFRLVLSSDTPCPARGEEDLILVRLDRRVVVWLRERLAACPDANSLGQLVGAPEPPALAAWIKRYRAFLRSNGGPGRPVYDARFAGSLGLTYLYVTKSDVWAALLALDFSQVATGTLSYVSVDDESIHLIEERVAAFLGLSLGVC